MAYKDSEDESKYRISALLRTVMRDASKEIKTEAIDSLFPDKLINTKNIAFLYRTWAWTIVSSLQNIGEEEPTQKQQKLLFYLWTFYLADIDIESFEPWQYFWMKEGLPLLTAKICNLTAIGKVAPMASLEAPEKHRRRRIQDAQW